MNKYPTINWLGGVESDAFVKTAHLGFIGPYEVRRLMEDFEPGLRYAVFCPPEMRVEDRWNYSCFFVKGENLDPADFDVELDPYHMCLFYELHENLTKKGTKE
jgi:hypothetical protein